MCVCVYIDMCICMYGVGCVGECRCFLCVLCYFVK